MFDIGFSELLLIGVVALVVLGPERLPKVARTAGHLFGRLQRYVATVKADLNREMEMSELAKVKQEVQEAARAFEQSAQEQTREFESEARAVSEAMQKQAIVEPPSPAAAASSQSELLLAQEEGLSGSGNEADAGSAAPQAIQTAPTRISTANLSAVPAVMQGTLDLGIEPARIARP